MKEFEEYLRRIGKSENTALTYCRNIRMYFSWCRDSFGSEPKELYRSNVLEYISYMRNIRGYSPKSVNNHLSALRCLNKYLVQSGRQSDMAVLDSDFMKVQIQYASPCSVDKKEVEAFRQRMLESGSKRDFAIVTLLVYAGLRRSECVDLKLDQVDLVAKEIRVIGKGDKQRLVYTTNPFYGKTVVATGKLENYTRDGIQMRLLELGAKPGSSVSKNTDYLIVGEKAGSKLAKAQQLGVKTLTEQEFENMLAE